MQDVWRLFAAIEVTDEVRARVGQVSDYLREAGWRANWTRPENSHVTLKFFGDVPVDTVPDLGSALEDATAAVDPFSLKTGRLGVFPSSRRPRVVWIGTGENDTALTRLHAAVEQAGETQGFAREERRFHGHITVGRLKPGGNSDAREIDRILASGPSRPALTFSADYVTLFRSELTRSGAVYTIVDQYPLGR